jgi:hypothetical protein
MVNSSYFRQLSSYASSQDGIRGAKFSRFDRINMDPLSALPNPSSEGVRGVKIGFEPPSHQSIQHGDISSKLILDPKIGVFADAGRKSTPLIQMHCSTNASTLLTQNVSHADSERPCSGTLGNQICARPANHHYPNPRSHQFRTNLQQC